VQGKWKKVKEKKITAFSNLYVYISV